MSNESFLIDQFVSITDASRDQATFFIESADGDLDQAVTQYFEHIHQNHQHDEGMNNERSRSRGGYNSVNMAAADDDDIEAVMNGLPVIDYNSSSSRPSTRRHPKQLISGVPTRNRLHNN